MNAKKAKRLRQLVRHLQHKGVISNGEWEQVVPVVTANGEEIAGKTALHPDCGKSVYKKMKKNAV
jgi:hypothetical protein